ncbi:hypothetical protein ACOSP7_025819 [Xanthoceras sorbifolium]
MASKKCLIAWAIFLVFVLFLTSQVTARPGKVKNINFTRLHSKYIRNPPDD